MTDRLALYWQPGCTSCLRTKEFLLERGLDFESINVLERPEALAELTRKGLRTVPVLTSGDRVCLAQDIDEVAAFVGVDLARVRLPVDVLAARLTALLETARAHARQLPRDRLETALGKRSRTWLDLSFHIPMIATAFLDAIDGGALTYEHYERVPVGPNRTLAHVDDVAADALDRLRSWRGSVAREAEPDSAGRWLTTYYGVRPLWAVLERTTWHVAQHCRQLESLLADACGEPPLPRLDQALLAGLPLPQSVWDRETTIA
jgi:glutaredoxin